jgi:1-acyl-sn-glycerol-3-phosphate acyltransferase
MFYSITRPFAKIALGLYFRKIYLTNREVIPKDKPLILASNHPTAFIDPCLLACYQKRPLHFLARGDLYVGNVFIRKLYDAYRMIPVFRRHDAGYSGVKTNFESFDRTFDALNENKAIMILAEGRTKHEKRLRPLMKGTARIVFGAWEKYGELDIFIVPVCINYTNSDKFRSEVMIDVREPIRVKDYVPLYEENQARAVSLVTDEIARRLMEGVIHIEDPKDDSWVEKLLVMKHNERKSGFWPVVVVDRSPLEQEKALTDQINTMPESRKLQLKGQVENYFSLLEKAGITDRGLVDHTSYNFPGAMILGLGWLPYMAGFVLNVFPVMLGSGIATKLAAAIEFRASMAVVFAAFLWLFYWLMWLTAAVIFGKSWLWAMVVLIPLLGLFYVFYRDIDFRWKACKEVALLDDDKVEALSALRSGIQV